MFILGIMALSQSLFLPGALLLKFLGFKGSPIQKLTYVIGLSLIITYSGIVLLVLLKSYNQMAALVLFGVQVTVLLRLCWHDLRRPILSILTQFWNRFVAFLNDLIKPLNEEKTSSLSKLTLSFFNLVFLVLALSVLWWGFKLILNYLGSIFEAWDVINSWNQWALAWVDGQVPMDSRNYPQLIPANWSLTYILMGNTKVQFFAKALMLPFTFLTLLLFMDLGIQTKKTGFWVGMVVTYFLLKRFLFPQLTNGYVDMAVAFFASLAMYSLVHLIHAREEDQRRVLLVLSGVFAGGAAMVKQSGVYIFLLYFPLIYLGVLRSVYDRNLRSVLKPLIFSFGLAVVLALPWYVFKFFAFRIGLDRPEVQDLVQITSNAYDGISPAAQLITALAQFEKYIALFPLILLGLVVLPIFYRWLTLLFVLPYPLIWAFVASYDTRNLAICLPIIGMIVGLVVEEFLLRSAGWAEKFKAGWLRMFFIPVSFLGILLLISYFMPASKLIAEHEKLQMQAFSPQKNKMIADIVAKEGPGVRILTNYPVDYLPGLEGVKVNFGYRDYNSFLLRIQEPAIEYLLLPRVIDPRIADHISQKLASGDYELIFENKEWLYYRLIRILKR